MGWGDYIMTTGIVRRLKRQNPNLQILVKEPFNKTRQYRDIFYKNPFIVETDTINEKLPHIKIPRVLAGVNDESKQKIIWSPERVAEVGNFYAKKEEIDFAEKNLKTITDHWKAKNQKQPKGIIFISDTAKRNMIIDKKVVYYEHAVNREWGEKKWRRFITLTSRDYILLKTSHIKEEQFDGLYSIVCDFRTSFSVMTKCDFFIGNEGGLAHLWAITRKKALVIFGHWIPPHVTGYSFHLNLSTNLNDHCGSLKRCEECLSFFNKLEPEYIRFLLDQNI